MASAAGARVQREPRRTIKILLVGCANLLADLAYTFLAPVEWRYAIVLMASSLLGAHYAGRIPPTRCGPRSQQSGWW